MTVLVRLVINGPTVLGGLTAVLILALLLFSLLLGQQGRRLRRSLRPDPDQGDATGDKEALR
jgi:hypothetical protein